MNDAIMIIIMKNCMTYKYIDV